MLNHLLYAFLFISTGFATTVPIPDNDPFYKPPLGFDSYSPGTVLKHRSVASGFANITAAQVLYRTTYVNGSAAATVATILTNTTSSHDKLVVYSDAEDSANSTCSPSYAFSTNNSASLGTDVTRGLSYGWTLVIPDYEGINSAFGSGRQEGYAVLDGLRAALNYAPAGISKKAKLGGYGYSGGAIATGWAASLQPDYAPELDIAGWTFGGTPSNITSTLQNVDGTEFAGYAFAGVAGTMAGYPAINARFSAIATAAGVAAIAEVRSQCSDANLQAFLFATIETTTYQTLGSQLLYDPTIATTLKNGTMGIYSKETPTAPIYMYHGQSDEVIPYASALKTSVAWCTNGASVEFVTETGGTGHLGTAAVLGQNATDWLDLRLSGVKAAKGCSNASFAETGESLKRESVGTTILERFGVGDEKVVADIKERAASGRKIPKLWSYLRRT